MVEQELTHAIEILKFKLDETQNDILFLERKLAGARNDETQLTLPGVE